MPNNRSNHFNAILLALFVTFLWSTSWVLIKIGLEEIPPVTFAGLRYFIAFLVLLPLALRPKQINEIKQITPKTWLLLIGLGVTFYALTQGAQFGSLKYLPATTFSLMLSFTSVLVVFLGIAFLNEIPTGGQWVGMCLFLIGVGFYFAESSAFQGEAIGWRFESSRGRRKALLCLQENGRKTPRSPHNYGQRCRSRCLLSSFCLCVASKTRGNWMIWDWKLMQTH